MIKTARLHVRHLNEDDAAPILELLNDTDFLSYIGDRGVRSLEDARGYIRSGPMQSYQTHGFGLNRVATVDGDDFMGICGLLKRDWLPEPDLGFAFLPAFRAHGFATESALAVLEHGRRAFGVTRVLAITAMENPASIRLLAKLGFREQEPVQAPGQSTLSRLFAQEH